eukprot:TRINITY_DN61388_c0_g1_i1.p1 TRINITY_DN61388_c0_g1~~TRINITY_DN61388_c0_g1_i1.p1  ORF type:complete len:372 (+),score=49.06 TRINITY_DN61388_c0_g1_i1:78-1193(+)
MNTTIGAALGAAGDSLNGAVDAVTGGDKEGPNWGEILAPVQQEMMEKYPGHELLALPDQTQLVFHKKVEITEIQSTLTSWGSGFDLHVETANTYAIRNRDEPKTTYYIVKEDKDMADVCMRDRCRRNMPYKFYLVDMRTGHEVAVLESDWACDDCCCGVWCVPICIPVCCCLRSGTWTMTPNGPNGEGQRVVAEVRQVPHCSPRTCCDNDVAVKIPDTGKEFSLYRKNCDITTCDMTCCLDLSEMHIIDANSDYENPLGRLWKSLWTREYEPTNDRYPALPPKSVAAESTGIALEVGKSLLGSDAGTYLCEVPFDHPAEKAGLLLGVLMHDMIYNETDNFTNAGSDEGDDRGPPVEEPPREEPRKESVTQI